MATGTKISTAFELEGFVEQRKELEQLLMTNSEMAEKVRKIIGKVMSEMRRGMVQAAQNAMDSDPRQAARAVRTMVYKQILGGNVNILRKKRASGRKSTYTPTRTLRTNQVGGNRRLRSERTKNLESYYGSDRGFVLRFTNAGTQIRGVKFNSDESRENIHRGSRGGNLQKYGKTINTGSRGRIGETGWFGKRSQAELANAAERLTQYIDELIKQEFGNG